MLLRKCNSQEIRAGYKLLQDLGLGVVVERCLFRKTPPDRAPPATMARLGLSPQQYANAFVKPLNKFCAAVLHKMHGDLSCFGDAAPGSRAVLPVRLPPP